MDNIVTDLHILCFRFNGDQPVYLFFNGRFFLQDRPQEILLFLLHIYGSYIGIAGFQGHSAANIHNGQHVLAPGQNFVHICPAGAVAVVGIGGGFEDFTGLAHGAEFAHRNILVPIIFRFMGAVGGIAD